MNCEADELVKLEEGLNGAQQTKVASVFDLHSESIRGGRKVFGSEKLRN